MSCSRQSEWKVFGRYVLSEGVRVGQIGIHKSVHNGGYLLIGQARRIGQLDENEVFAEALTKHMAQEVRNVA